MIETAKARDDGESGSQMGTAAPRGAAETPRGRARRSSRDVYMSCAPTVCVIAAGWQVGRQLRRPVGRVSAVACWGKARTCICL